MVRVRWISALLAAVMLVAAIGIVAPSDAQDRTSQRLDDLETRVAALETQVATLVTPIATSSAQAQTYTIAGSFELFGEEGTDYYLGPGGCLGQGGYADVRAGAQVRVTDEGGKLIGSGKLKPNLSVSESCAFTFSVKVHKASFYKISIGAERRGSIAYSFDEMVQNKWQVGLSLGS